ncbi:MAG: hypothetical protein GEV06_28005 [Luteitalea sp.]|nr:hypothetical protein [Luteitalea sp.]
MIATMLRRAFAPSDHVAVMFLHLPTGRIWQRVLPAHALAESAQQRWLRAKNAHGHDVFASLNTFLPGCQRRTKAHVVAIRHLFLDVDRAGAQVLQQLRSEPALPPPTYIIETSRGRFQLLWRVDGFTLSTLEALQQHLARRFGTDPAAIDATRCFRLPGLFNHKYDPPYFVRLRAVADPHRLFRPEDFQFSDAPVSRPAPAPLVRRPAARASLDMRTITQSHRDWAWARRRLEAGEHPEDLVGELSLIRVSKPQPRDYAERTVDRAWAVTRLRRGAHALRLADELAAMRSQRADPVAYAQQIVSRAAAEIALMLRREIPTTINERDAENTTATMTLDADPHEV